MTYQQICQKAAEIAKHKQDDRYVLRNPDYPEEGGEFVIASDYDMETFYAGTPDSAILAVFLCDGKQEAR